MRKTRESEKTRESSCFWLDFAIVTTNTAAIGMKHSDGNAYNILRPFRKYYFENVDQKSITIRKFEKEKSIHFLILLFIFSISSAYIFIPFTTQLH